MSQPSVTHIPPSRSLRLRQRTHVCVNKRRARTSFTVLLIVGVAAAVPTSAAADEGGVSFWIPGILAASRPSRSSQASR